MLLKLIYDSIAEVPEKFRELFSEKDGKAVLSGIDGMKTQADVDYVLNSLRQERDAHKETKGKLSAWIGVISL